MEKNESMGFVELEWVCPNCDSRNRGSIKTCQNCGAPQPTNVKFQRAADEKIVTDEKSVAAAKAAADAWVLALADEFKGSAATANILVVPAIATPRIREAEPEAALGSFVDAETIAAAMLALCAEVTPGLNGQRITLPTRGGA